MSQVEIKPGLADVPVAQSGVSFIDGKHARLSYRGIAVETLALESNFEETTWLLIKGELPTQRELTNFDQSLRQRRSLHYRLIELLKQLPENGHPMDSLQTGVAAMGMFYPQRDATNPAQRWEASLKLIASIPTIVAAYARLRQGKDPISPHPDLDHASNFYWMLFGTVPTPSVRKVLNACLILHAEHSMNASTFTARVTSSSLANPYATIAAAVGSLSGPLHGGANEEVLQMLMEIGSVEKVKPWLDEKRKADPHFKVMGMGHRVYKVKDPRATVLQELAEHVFAESSRPVLYDIALALESYAANFYSAKGVYPNVDFFSGVVYRALGIETDLFTPIFAIARISGWLAHWHEQMKENRIYRPEQDYIGKMDAPYVPIDKRP